MIRRHIPTNYEFDADAVLPAIGAWVAAHGIQLQKHGYGIAGRVLFVDANPTAAQLTDLKSRLLPLFATITDL